MLVVLKPVIIGEVNMMLDGEDGGTDEVPNDA